MKQPAVDGVVRRTIKTRARTSPSKITLAPHMAERSAPAESSMPLARALSSRARRAPSQNDDVSRPTSHAKTGTPATRAHYIVGGISLVVLVVFLGIYSRARVVITPVQSVVSVSIPVTAAGMKSISVTDTVSEEIPASGSTTVESFARGKVTLYNTGPVAQKLSARTRLESKDGRLYYIDDEAVTIPAGTADVPGTVDVAIVASQPGSDYNSDATDFVFPGWREAKSPKFTSQYARSITALSGGGQGSRPTIDPVELERITALLQTRLAARLNERAMKETPNPWSIVAGSASIQMEPIITTMIGQSKARIELSGTLSGSVVNRYIIGRRGAETLPQFANRDVVATDIHALVQSPDQSALVGSITLEPALQPAEIERTLLGVSRAAVPRLLSENPLIQGAEIRLYPLWAGGLPRTTDRIEVIIRSDETSKLPTWP